MSVFEGLRNALGLKAVDFDLREKRLDLALAEAKVLYTLNEDAIRETIAHSLRKSYENSGIPRFIEVHVNPDSREVMWKLRETDDMDALRDSFFMPSEPVPDMRPRFREVLDRARPRGVKR